SRRGATPPGTPGVPHPAAPPLPRARWRATPGPARRPSSCPPSNIRSERLLETYVLTPARGWQGPGCYNRVTTPAPLSADGGRAAPARCRRRRGLQRQRLRRQRQGEGCPVARVALGAQVAPVSAGDLARDRQAEPRAPGPSSRPLVERLEQVR